MRKFRPTYLYIKRHSITGKLYFGKTVRNPETYCGSGAHWLHHVKYHGIEHIETLWYCLFYEEETIREFAAICSKSWNIVKSPDWLNLVEENGVGDIGAEISHDTRAKMRAAKLGKKLVLTEKRMKQLKDQMVGNKIRTGTTLTAEHKAAIAVWSSGRVFSEESREKIAAANRGQKRSDERRANMRKAKLGTKVIHKKRTCPHCGLIGAGGAMTQYHFDNCKKATCK